MEGDHETHSNWVEDCISAKQCSNSPFSEWEEEFIDSISDQLQKKRSLSQKQVDTLERIWEKI